MAGRVLIVDDDPVQRRHIEAIVGQEGYSCESLGGGDAALARLSRSDGLPISAMFLDLVMPDLDGMAVLERLERLSIFLPVIVQVAEGGSDAAVSAMRAGAFDFLVKPASEQRIRASLSNAIRIAALESEVGRMRRRRNGAVGFSDVIMRAPIMERVASLAGRAARNVTPVLLEGERGVGKELVARAIHGTGPRRTKPFVKVNCAALAETEVERTLFGTDTTDSPSTRGTGGKVAEARGGTLFLNQIGALPDRTQANLLRLLKDSRAPDVRLIATTNQRLVELVAAGRFREDLFHCLNVLPIWIPPLRERRSDIPELARRILTRLAAEEGTPRISGISAAAMEVVASHDWPGNLRQLESVLFRAAYLAEGAELAPKDFPQLQAGRSPRFVEPAPRLQEPPPDFGVADQRQNCDEQGRALAPLADRIRQARYGVARLLDERGELRPFEVLEAEVIRFAVDHYQGHMSEVARRLGIGRSTLYRKLRDYGIASEEVMAR